MFKKVLFLIIFLASFSSAIAEEGVLQKSYRIYSKDADNLFMYALNAISSDEKFAISEIQTKNGYILFTSGSKYYLLKVTKRYKNQSEVKVLPQNSDFSQGSDVARTVFNLIDNEIKKPMELIK